MPNQDSSAKFVLATFVAAGRAGALSTKTSSPSTRQSLNLKDDGSVSFIVEVGSIPRGLLKLSPDLAI